MKKCVDIRYLVMTFLLQTILLSCNSKLENALIFSGDNRAELERVLDYFQKGTDEYNAAVFLIENMPGHKCMTGDYANFYDDIKDYLSRGYGLAVVDSLTELSKRYEHSIKYEYVSKVITAQYLIKDIENALEQWRRGGWATHLNFEEFCEWLLPYTCSSTQPLIDWRTSFEPFGNEHLAELGQCSEFLNNPRAAVQLLNDSLLVVMRGRSFKDAFKGFPFYSMELLTSLPGATCKNYTENGTLFFRSKGIPIAIDFITQWATREGRHDWTVFRTLRGELTPFNPFSGITTFAHYNYARLPKVFRRTYAPNPEYMELLRRNNGNVPPIFDDPFFSDVTHQYGSTANIEVDLLPDIKHDGKDVYIAVFDNNKWAPVYWGKRKGRKAGFNNVGTSITYIVMGYNNNELVPLSLPFKLNAVGGIEYIGTDNGSAVHNFELWRKFPMFRHVYLVYNYLKGGYVEASNDRNFTKSEIVCRFDSPFWTSGIAEVVQSQPYRYWRCCTGSADTTDLAELYFYVNGNKSFSATGGENAGKQPYGNLFDGDPLTNYRVVGNNVIEYLDYGEPVTMDHISYVRRGDGNAIIPGDKYKIYYWCGSKWVLHSEHMAEDVKLNLKDIPDGALCYIKGISRGNQNRIFRYNHKTDSVEWL